MVEIMKNKFCNPEQEINANKNKLNKKQVYKTVNFVI